jgi:hypothetical protein
MNFNFMFISLVLLWPAIAASKMKELSSWERQWSIPPFWSKELQAGGCTVYE